MAAYIIMCYLSRFVCSDVYEG